MEESVGDVDVGGGATGSQPVGGLRGRRSTRAFHWPLVHRRLGRNWADGDRGHLFAAPEDTHGAIAGDFADYRAVQVPLLKNADDVLLAAALGDDEHSLLRLGQHDFVRSHSAFANGHFVEVEANASSRAAGHLERG